MRSEEWSARIRPGARPGVTEMYHGSAGLQPAEPHRGRGAMCRHRATWRRDPPEGHLAADAADDVAAATRDIAPSHRA